MDSIKIRSRWLGAIALSLGLAFTPGLAAADTDITASNQSEDADVETGDAEASNHGDAFVGHQGGEDDDDEDVAAQDIDNRDATNVQEGDNELDAEQNAEAESGDAVAGSVIGAVVTGDLSVNATNLSEDVDLETGDAISENDFEAFVGLAAGFGGDGAGGGAGGGTVTASDIDNLDAENVQEGDNEADLDQDTVAVSGDAVGGQIFGGVVTGASDIVLANTSDDVDGESGDAENEADSDIFTGLIAAGIIEV